MIKSTAGNATWTGRATVFLILAAMATLALASPAWAAFPGENGKIAFTSARDGNYEIYAMDADGSNPTNLTNHPADDSELAFSSDGTKITFTSNRDGNQEVYSMNADGSNPTNLTNDPARDGGSTFSPDGSKIAFVSTTDFSYEIYSMDADGSNLTNLTKNLANDTAPTFSPDGSRIAFVSNRHGNNEVYVMNADGTNQTRLTNNTWTETGPTFSPDGSRIAFTSYGDDGNAEVYVMDANGSNPTRLTNNAAQDLNPAFSPDGSRIAFASDRDGNTEVYVMDADGSIPTNRTNDVAGDFAPDWQPLNQDLSVLSSGRPDPVSVGQNLTYSFAVANSGGADARSVVLTATLPAGVEFVSASAGCANDAGTVRCGLGDLARGASTTVEVVVRPTAEGTITNTATVTGNARDANPMDNTDRQVTQVILADSDAPAAPAITGPANNTRDADGFFVVRGNAEPGAMVRLFEGTMRVGTDEADPESGVWRIVVGEATEGSHSYRAKATDAADNASAWSNTLKVIVDTTKPSVLATSPASGATGVALGANVTATFSEAMMAASVKGSTFKLVKAGTTTAVSAKVSYDAARKKATLNPSANLARGTKYTVTVTSEARDLAGNRLDQSKAQSGEQPKSWSFTTAR